MKDYIKVLFPHEEFDGINYESAWAKKNGKCFQLDNILFYAKEYSYGDLFSVKKINGFIYYDRVETGKSLQLEPSGEPISQPNLK